jgi:hypothetical protein
MGYMVRMVTSVLVLLIIIGVVLLFYWRVHHECSFCEWYRRSVSDLRLSFIYV